METRFFLSAREKLLHKIFNFVIVALEKFHRLLCNSKSVLRRWGVSGNKRVAKETAIETIPVSSSQNNELPPARYDVRLDFNQIKNVASMLKLKSQPFKIDKNISFSHVLTATQKFGDNSLRGMFANNESKSKLLIKKSESCSNISLKR